MSEQITTEVSAYDLLKRLKEICYERQRRLEDCGFTILEIADIIAELKPKEQAENGKM